MLALGIFPFEELECCVVVDGTAEIPFLAVDCCGENILGQAAADRLGNFKRSNAGFKPLYAIIGESDVDHFIYNVV